MIGKRSRETEQLLTTMERQIDRIHTALIVRDPGTTLSADAYEGLRKQVIASASSRLQHVAQLAEFDVALRRGASAEDLAALIDQWLGQAGIERVEDPSVQGAWETDAIGHAAEVEIPAYVDGVTGRLVRQGRLRLTRETPQPIREDTQQPESAEAGPAPGGVDADGSERPSEEQAGDERYSDKESEGIKGDS